MTKVLSQKISKKMFYVSIYFLSGALLFLSGVAFNQAYLEWFK
jgi:hypothetical protein